MKNSGRPLEENEVSDITNRNALSLVSRIPREALNIAGTVLGLFLVVAAGALISEALPPDPSPWLFAGSYLAPGALAFAVYWYIAQRL